MANTNFNFKSGDKGEKLWYDYIAHSHKEIERAPKKKFYDWDLRGTFNDRVISYEVKYDLSGVWYSQKFKRPLNFYIEYENTNKNEDSGILASKADYYVYIFNADGKNVGYVFDRLELLNHLQSAKYDIRTNKAGGDNNANGWLAPVEQCTHLSRAIIDLDKQTPRIIKTNIK